MCACIFDLTALVYSINYMHNIISEPQQGLLAPMLLALCEFIYAADGLETLPAAKSLEHIRAEMSLL